MGNKNSGRRPRASALKVLYGRPDRINRYEPKLEIPPATFNIPPPEIAADPVAVDEWVRVVPILRECGMVTELERGSLIALCRQWSRYLAAERDIADIGTTVEYPRGPVLNPSVGIADRALTQCLRLWQQLGMTPTGRTKTAAIVKREAAAPSKWAGVV